MKVEFKRSFDHTFSHYPNATQQKIHATIERLVVHLEQRQLPQGLGLKLLRSKSRLWEARVSGDLRLIFRLEQDLIEFGLVGSHDDVRRYLRHC